MKIICSKCGASPLDGFALFRDNGALFSKSGYNATKKRGRPLFCAACAPDKIKKALIGNARVDAFTQSLAAKPLKPRYLLVNGQFQLAA